MNTTEIIPRKERIRIRDRKVRALYGIGYTYDEIILDLKNSGIGISKGTISNILNKGRKKGKNA